MHPANTFRPGLWRRICVAYLIVSCTGWVITEANSSEKGMNTEHWAFQPLPPLNHAAPETQPIGRPRIDAFIEATLSEHNLALSSEADRPTLIRRLYFDLVGLPPSVEALDAALADTRPDAWSRLVDQLLASPAYGEKWSRMWLDQVRYADQTAGWFENMGSAWLYRDWVIQALNTDMAYPEFVKRQLATDLMPSTGPEDIPALGFLGLSPTYWKELKLAPEVIKTIVADEWEERVDMMSRTLLGLTVSCARCHDHKSDPVSMQDYYALAGIVSNIRLTQLPIVPDDQWRPIADAREQVRRWNEEIEGLKKSESVEAKEKLKTLRKQIDSLIAETPNYDLPMAHAIDDAFMEILPDGPNATKLVYQEHAHRDLEMHVRGDPNREGGSIPRGFFQMFGGSVLGKENDARLEWVDTIFEYAEGLAARVIVNRVWKEHFGEGVVTTPGNFGLSGASPTHRELLDDLAARFVVNGWSLKWLHREILLSRTWRQTSQVHEKGQQVDPQNKLLWRMPRRRLSIEAWRDAMLAVSGRLDPSLGGPSQDLSLTNNVRRTVYGTVHRRDLNDLLKLHDFPDPNRYSEQRIDTTTPVQQLFALNGPLVRECSLHLADLVLDRCRGDYSDWTTHLFRQVWGRVPSSEEVTLFETFFRSETDAQTDTQEILARCAQTLLTSNAFLYVD